MIFEITKNSLKHRWPSTLLLVLSLSVSLTLLFSVERLREGARSSFMNTIRGADLIVGARGGELELLLYTVFNMGRAVNNISYESYEDLASRPQVKWAIPISLGDSFRGHRVVGTNNNFFEHYRYYGDRSIEFLEGGHFTDYGDVIIGHEVFKAHQLSLDSEVLLSHGQQVGGGIEHDNFPFTVKGILAPTGTPIDQAVYVMLEGIEIIHKGWETGAPRNLPTADQLKSLDISPELITSFILKTHSPIFTLRFQREIINYPNEALIAIMPAMTLQDLWKTIGNVEKILMLVSWLIFAVSALSLFLGLYSSLEERRREIAIYRSLGLSSFNVFSTFFLETLMITLGGIILALVNLNLLFILMKDVLRTEYSVYLEQNWVTPTELFYSLIFIGITLLVAIIPAIKAYKQSLKDGLTPTF